MCQGQGCLSGTQHICVKARDAGQAPSICVKARDAGQAPSICVKAAMPVRHKRGVALIKLQNSPIS